MRKNILHVAHFLTGRADGIFTHINQIVKATEQHNYYHFICVSKISKDLEYICTSNVRLLEIPGFDSKLPLLAFFRLYMILIKYKIDIIHTHYVKSYIVSGLCNIILRKKHIYNYHGSFINNKFYTEIEKIILNFMHKLINIFNAVDLVIVPSFYSKRELLSENNNFPKIEVYYNSVSFPDKHPDENFDISESIKTSSGRKILFVGRLAPEKAPQNGLSILKQMISNGNVVTLHFFGEGELLAQLKAESRALHIEEFVYFYGFIKNPWLYFKYFDVLLIPSKSEGLPLVFWEALTNGLAIVASKVGGMTEVIKEYKCGLLFNSNKLDEAVQNIDHLLNDSDFKTYMIKHGKDVFNKHFNFSIFQNKIIAFYEQF